MPGRPGGDRLRAQIALTAAPGWPNARIAAGLGISVDTVRKWRGRFAARGLDGLQDLPRTGRPRRISAADRAAVVSLACQLPAATGVPLARWTGPELAAELTARALVSAPMPVTPFMDLAARVTGRPEYRDAPRVFVIAGNGPDHRGQAAIERLRTAHPNAIMIHTPVHASWLNQIEIFFSIVQKKVVSPNDFPSLQQLSGTLLAFTGRYNQTAKPFTWEFTAADLTDLLHRIGEHEQAAAAHQTDLATAA